MLPRQFGFLKKFYLTGVDFFYLGSQNLMRFKQYTDILRNCLTSPGWERDCVFGRREEYNRAEV